MQYLEGSGTPVLYTGRTVLKGQTCVEENVQHAERGESFKSRNI